MTAFAHVFSLALLHFLWQGTVVAILLWMVLFAMRRRSANARYVVSCVALAVLMALPAATAYVFYEHPAPVSGVELRARTAQPFALAKVRTADWLNSFQNSFQVWAVPVWCLGVLIFSARLVWGSRQVARMRRRGEAAEEALCATVARIAQRMGMDCRVGVLISILTDGPSVIGFVRPTILLPAATILGLTPEQLEAVLAHELAHIRRYDHVVNVVQALAEALLFYHPAVWWISGRIRSERELCCDDEAVRVCGDAFGYARALTALERMRVMTPSLVLGVADGSLSYRIKRLVGAAPQDHLPSRLPGLMALCLALACLGVSVNRVRAQAPDAPGVRVDLGSSAVIHRAPVEYPAASQIGNVRGTVSVELHLDSSGNVSDARVLSGPEELRKPVLQSVLDWHFTPDAAGATRVVNVEFQAPAQDRARAAVEVNRTKRTEPTTAFLQGEIDQAKAALEQDRANLAQAETRGLDEDGIRAREAQIRAMEAQIHAAVAELEAKRRDAEVRNGAALEILPTRAKPLLLPAPMATKFEGRVLRSVRLVGLGMSTEDFLAQAQLPIRVGDTLTQSSIEAAVAAVRKFDEHLVHRWAAVEPNGIELTIFAPGEPVGRSARSGVGVGVGIGVDSGDGARAGVSAPALIYRTQPEYSEEAKKAKWQGSVVLSVMVDETGKPTDVKVTKPLGMGLDEKAVEAVSKWVFRPGMRDGKPVPVLATVEVNFRVP